MRIFLLLLIISPHLHLAYGQFELHNENGQESQTQAPQASATSKPDGEKPEEPGVEKPQKEGGEEVHRTDEFDDYLGDYEDPPSSNDDKKTNNMTVESTGNSNESISAGGPSGGKSGNEDDIPADNSSNPLNYSFYFILLFLSMIFMIKIDTF